MSKVTPAEEKALLEYIQACNRAAHIAALCLSEGTNTRSFNSGLTNGEMLQESAAGNVIATGALYVNKIISHGKISEMVDRAAAEMAKEARLKNKAGLTVVK